MVQLQKRPIRIVKSVNNGLFTERNMFMLSIVTRIGFFYFGLYQDKNMPVPYTDIDYLVFTDAADYMNRDLSPYLRETYRYTPLLAWLLQPNVTGWYSFGKWLFMFCDVVTGWLILKVLDMQLGPIQKNGQQYKRLILASIWLLNPMVITISTRGSSESILTVFIMAFVYFLLKKNLLLSGIFAALSIHFKIYPIIYIPTAILYLSDCTDIRSLIKKPKTLINSKSIEFITISFITVLTLGSIMFYKYGNDFLNHSYLYHLVRIDHRHNFSIYNVSLYFTNALNDSLDLTKIAFIPQLLISAILIPLAFTKLSITSTLFLQTFAFVTFNKVITSQYFIWFLIFLPLYLEHSSFLGRNKVKGVICLILWIISQSSWLLFAYKLEFLGQATFFPGLLSSAVFFFLSNIYILKELIDDVSQDNN